MRTVIYARFSSTLQNARSIEDQVALCRNRCEREGWEVVEVFADYAISGAAGIGESARPGLNAMMMRVEAGGVDQVLAEATDRIARHQGDAFAIRERITFAGARLFTISDGVVTEITATFRGLMDAQFRKDLGAKIKRGQRGTLSQGRSPAGKAYGYSVANRIEPNGEITRGLRKVNDEQADIVRRIFTEFAAGISSRGIAERLNADGIAGPTGGFWRTTTIYGDRKRRNGMLQNQLYIGKLVHNRTSKVIDPRTRAVRIRANAESEWLVQDVPELRIVDDILWEAVQQRRFKYEGRAPNLSVRPKHVLSGLTRCGMCDGGWTIIRRDRWGCSRHREGGKSACSNNRTIGTADLESRVVGGLQSHMLAPELVEVYVREYHLDYARRAKEMAKSSDALRRRKREVAARIDALVKAISNGLDDFDEVRAALVKLRIERDDIEAHLADIEQLPVVALHPTVARDYRAEVEKLTVALDSNGEARLDAIPKLRALIDYIRVLPDTSCASGVTIDLTGRLANILALATGQAPKSASPLALERVRGIEPL